MSLNTLEIDALSSDGRGLARRKDGEKVVFVSGALPGEIVEAEFVAEKKNFAEARAVRLLEASSATVPSPCPHAKACGGCPLIRLDYASQLEWKGRFVVDALRRVGRLGEQPDTVSVIASPERLGYRNRVELAFGLDAAGRTCLGMRTRQSHRVTPVPGCRIMPPGALSVMAVVERLARESRLVPFRLDGNPRHPKGSGFLRFCQIREGLPPTEACLEDGRCAAKEKALWVILLTSEASRAERDAIAAMAGELLETCHDVHSVIHEERTRNDLLVQGERRVLVLTRDDRKETGEVMALPVLGQSYLLDPCDFFQVNTPAADIMVKEIKALVSRDALVDLYCGSGAPGLNTGASSILGLEFSARAVDFATRNGQRFQKDARYLAGDVKRSLRHECVRSAVFDQLVVDPPRAGMDPAAISFLQERRPACVLYVSCNPATLARDVGLLAADYTLAALRPVDYFPQTPHVECLVLLQRRPC